VVVYTYQRVFKDGKLDNQVAIYRDADYGPCEVCLLQEDNWTDRVIDETVIYSSQFQIEMVLLSIISKFC